MNSKPQQPKPNQAANDEPKLVINADTKPAKSRLSYDKADLEEYCLWLYGLFEEDVVNSK